VIVLSIIFAFFLLCIERRVTTINMTSVWNGYGAIRPVNQGKSLSPMQYRVFVPWLYAILPILSGRNRYDLIKFVGLWFALYAFGFFCKCVGVVSWQGMVFLAALLPVTFLFDYADCYYELGFLSLGLGIATLGQQYLIWLVPLTLLAALNRETAIFIPLGYFAMNGGYIGAVFLMGVAVVGLIIPRAWYGKKRRYCEWYMLSRNWNDLLHKFQPNHMLLLILMVWFIAIAPICYLTNLWGLYIVMVLFIGMMAVPSVWTEIRVFMPVFLVLIPATLAIL